uniref:DUF1269 domain-containing protein n=1 Tax=Candidatus Kentrum sp. TC TaxID=2126339 RepID=A0A450Z033_9GAMM|nr:MAG: hypothetical protein BECKTC1821D_GA0114238_10226 [Candidatus Kentron sp. TC]VFK47127.1 MAG: hypothetical protein BECKTC1821E_GA0114239_10777 [Candidatus Kentron sp. TC]VFK57969.1 MAG: hypothetical protein BECKTC1821F_GA0114240_10216 [Candidatus Kentron sp. TC]
MSKRLYFLVPDVDTCRTIVNELKDFGIPESHTHVIGNHFTPLDGLHEASFLQKSEFTHGIEEGLGVGGAAGLVGGLLAATFPPAGLVLGGGALLVSTLAGAGLGAVISAIVAKDIPNRKLEAFEDAISEGELLLLVDAPKRRINKLMDIIRGHHPEVEIGMTTPSPALGKSDPA